MAAEFDRDGRRAVVGCERALLLVAILGVPDIANAYRRISYLGDNKIVELCGSGKRPMCAQYQFAWSLIDAARRNFGVLARDCVAYSKNRDLVGGKPVGVDPQIDRALLATVDDDLTHATHGLDGVFHASFGDS